MTPPPSPDVRPPPYSMCSQEECADRERFGEVSVFECHNPTSNGRPPPPPTVPPANRGRRIDPRLAVSKYRRSAAGSSVEDRYPVRTVGQLETAVGHVLGILAEQRAPPTDGSCGESGAVRQRRETMLATVAFVEDRLRAVQVDLVKLGHPEASRPLQLRMARMHILILYLMGDCAAYEAKFGAASLQAALASYFASPSSDSAAAAALVRGPEDADPADEVLSYALLLALRHDLLEAARNDGGGNAAAWTSASTALAAHRRRFRARLLLRRSGEPAAPGSLSTTTLQWTMLLLSHLVNGHWHMALRHLGSRRPGTDRMDAEDHRQAHDAFVTRARCLLAPCLRHMRFEAVKSYNASFGKGEAVPAAEVARLLHMHPSSAKAEAAGGAHRSAWEEEEGGPDNDSPANDPSAASGPGESGGTSAGAAEAALRFGRDVGLQVGADGAALVFKVSSSPPLRMRADRSVRDEEDLFVLRGWECGDESGARTDSDGVLIPPPPWMRRHAS